MTRSKKVRASKVIHGTKKPAKSMAGTLTCDDANRLHHEFEHIVFCIEEDFRSLDKSFDLLFAPDPIEELHLQFSGDVFRRIRIRVNALQARIRKVRDLGHTSEETSNV